MSLSVLDQSILRDNLLNILLSYGYESPISPDIAAELDIIISFVDPVLESQHPSIYQNLLTCTIPPLTAPQDIKNCIIFQKFREYRVLCEWLSLHPERADEFLNNQACKLACENDCISTDSISMPAGESIKKRDFDIYNLLANNAIKNKSYFCQLAQDYLCQLIPCDDDVPIRFIGSKTECPEADNGCC